MPLSSCLRASLPLWKVFVLSLLAFWQLPAAEPAKPAQTGPSVHEFKFPKSACYHCLDQEEAERRWRLAQEMATADLYELRSSGGASPTMTPLLKSAVVKFISGGSGPDGMMGLGLNVTEKQRTAVEAAIAKKQLLVIYYHYGW